MLIGRRRTVEVGRVPPALWWSVPRVSKRSVSSSDVRPNAARALGSDALLGRSLLACRSTWCGPAWFPASWAAVRSQGSLKIGEQPWASPAPPTRLLLAALPAGRAVRYSGRLFPPDGKPYRATRSML